MFSALIEMNRQFVHASGVQLVPQMSKCSFILLEFDWVKWCNIVDILRIIHILSAVHCTPVGQDELQLLDEFSFIWGLTSNLALL